MARTWCLAFVMLAVGAGVAGADPAKKPERVELPHTIWCGSWLDLGGPVAGPRIEKLQDPPPPEVEALVIAIEDVLDGGVQLKTKLDDGSLSRRRPRCLLCR